MTDLVKSKVTVADEERCYAWLYSIYLTDKKTAIQQAKQNLTYSPSKGIVIVQAVANVKEKGSVDLNLPQIEV